MDIEELLKLKKEKVIKGLKFIAENQELSYETFKLTLSDIISAISYSYGKNNNNNFLSFDEGLKNGDIESGYLLIIEMMRSEMNREIYTRRYLEHDDDTSIYNFIRVVTGNDNYTLKNFYRKPLGKNKYKAIIKGNDDKSNKVLKKIKNLTNNFFDCKKS